MKKPTIKKHRFDCVIASREDFYNVGYDGSKLSDEQMTRIASKIGDTLVENYYWECMESWAEELELPVFEPKCKKCGEYLVHSFGNWECPECD